MPTSGGKISKKTDLQVQLNADLFVAPADVLLGKKNGRASYPNKRQEHNQNRFPVHTTVTPTHTPQSNVVIYGFCITNTLLIWLKREKMSYFGGPALVHQVNILVSSDPKQAQTCWCRKNKQASIAFHLC